MPISMQYPQNQAYVDALRAQLGDGRPRFTAPNTSFNMNSGLVTGSSEGPSALSTIARPVIDVVNKAFIQPRVDQKVKEFEYENDPNKVMERGLGIHAMFMSKMESKPEETMRMLNQPQVQETLSKLKAKNKDLENLFPTLGDGSSGINNLPTETSTKIASKQAETEAHKASAKHSEFSAGETPLGKEYIQSESNKNNYRPESLSVSLELQDRRAEETLLKQTVSQYGKQKEIVNRKYSGSRMTPKVEGLVLGEQINLVQSLDSGIGEGRGGELSDTQKSVKRMVTAETSNIGERAFNGANKVFGEAGFWSSGPLKDSMEEDLVNYRSVLKTAALPLPGEHRVASVDLAKKATWVELLSDDGLPVSEWKRIKAAGYGAITFEQRQAWALGEKIPIKRTTQNDIRLID